MLLTQSLHNMRGFAINRKRAPWRLNPAGVKPDMLCENQCGPPLASDVGGIFAKFLVL